MDDETIFYQPKGGMCVVCKNSNADCSKLDFSKMPIIEKSGSIRVVKCSGFEKKMDTQKAKPIIYGNGYCDPQCSYLN